MAPHSSTLAWEIPRTEEPGGLQSMGSQRVGHDGAASLSLSCIGEGNGNPLQYSCLENPRDGGVWRAAVYGVAQSRTRQQQQQQWLFLGAPHCLFLKQLLKGGGHIWVSAAPSPHLIFLRLLLKATTDHVMTLGKQS